MENNKRLVLVLVLGLKEEKGLRVFAVTESMVGFLKLPIWSEKESDRKLWERKKGKNRGERGKPIFFWV